MGLLSTARKIAALLIMLRKILKKVNEVARKQDKADKRIVALKSKVDKYIKKKEGKAGKGK